MIGFLAAGALAGLASLGWPVYLHLRKRRRRIVQVVPSLVLFSLGRRSSRRPIVEERLLLASRLLLLLFLCLLVAQPYVETARSLPLPRLHEETPADTCVGVLLDDSLTSLHGETGRTRLDLSRRWLTREIRSLPASTRVVIALTSFPYATRPMTRERALELLELVRPVPRRGRAAAALGALQHTLRGVDGALVVAASRDSVLWSDLQQCADREGRWSIQFLDTSDRRLPWLIHSVEPAGAGGSGNGWVCNLLGERNAMVGETLVVEANDGRIWRCEIGPGDAERGRISLLLPRRAGPCWFAAHAGGSGHPWSVWRFRTEDAARRRCPGGVVVLRPATRQGLLIDKVITAALLATYPDCRIHHLDPAGPADSMPDVGAIVYVGTAPPGASLAAWFSERFEKGANLLCLPTDEDASRLGTGRALGLLPTWGAPVAMKPGSASRIAEVRGSSADGFIDGLLLKGLRQSLFGCLMPPSFGDCGETVVTAGDGVPLLVTRGVGESGRAWALASPLSLHAESVVYHPAFPLLVRRLLFKGLPVQGSGGGPAGPDPLVEVGDTAELHSWFGFEGIKGRLSLPSGESMEIDSPNGAPAWTNVPEEGPYLLDTPEGSRVRLVNYPRLRSDTLLTHEYWEGAVPRSKTVWLTESDGLAPSVGRMGASTGDGSAARYDLGPFLMLLVSACMLFECCALVICWRWRTEPDG